MGNDPCVDKKWCYLYNICIFSKGETGMNRGIKDYESDVYLGFSRCIIANGRKYFTGGLFWGGQSRLDEEIKSHHGSFVGSPKRREVILKMKMKRVFKNK